MTTFALSFRATPMGRLTAELVDDAQHPERFAIVVVVGVELPFACGARSFPLPRRRSFDLGRP
jgi:hypothetical protein